MIILEDQVADRERALPASPNKEGETVDADTPTPVVLPPPYVPLSEHPLVPSYPAHIHQPVPSQPQRRSALKRFFKAFALALLILFLIRMFFWSLADASWNRGRHPHTSPGLPTEKDWSLVPLHRKATDPSDSRCKQLTGSDGSEPRRVLSAGYPPDIPGSEENPWASRLC